MKNITIAGLLALFVLMIGAVHPAQTSAEDQIMCTMQYQPVCGTEKGIYKTYGNSCVLGAESAVFQHEGECSAAELRGEQEGEYVPPTQCTAWNDGCNSCGRGTGGQAYCTKMACMGTPRAGYCTAYGESESPISTPHVDTGVSSSAGVSSSNPVAPSSVSGVDGSTDGSVAAEGEVEASATISTEEAEPGFVHRLWASIVAWFSNLF